MHLPKFLLPEGMIAESKRLGELPSAREVYSTSFQMSWPSALESVLVSLIASVDTMMVGSIGSGAIAAVGITTQPKFILLAVIMTLNIGVVAVVARRKGERNTDGAKKCLKQALMLCFGLALVLNVLGEIFARPLLRLAGAQPDYISTAVTYFRIILVGNFFSSLSLTMTAAQRGYGNTRISMTTNCAANLINVLFNWLLINGVWIFPRLGVTGAAIATVLGNFVAFSIALVSLLRHEQPLNLYGGSWSFDKPTMRSVGKVWSSAFVEQIAIRVGFFLYSTMVAALGTVAFAAHQICMQIINLSFAFGDGLGVATTSLSGQQLGAKRPDLAIVYANVGQRFAMFVGLVLSILFIVLRYPLLRLFTTEQAVITLGSGIMLVLAVVALTQPSQVVIAGCLRASGDNKYVAVVSLISIGVLRPLTSYIICYPLGFGLIGAWIGLYIDQIVRLILYGLRFLSGKWTQIEL